MSNIHHVLEQLLTNGKIEESLVTLKSYFEKKDKTYLTTVNLLNTRFNQNKLKFHRGTITQSDFDSEYNKIVEAIWGLIVDKKGNPNDVTHEGNVYEFKRLHLVKIIVTITAVASLVCLVIFSLSHSHIYNLGSAKSIEYVDLKDRLQSLENKITLKSDKCRSMPVETCEKCYNELAALNSEYGSLQKMLAGFTADYNWLATAIQNLPDDVKGLAPIKLSFKNGKIREAEQILDSELKKLLTDATKNQKDQNRLSLVATLYVLKARMVAIHYEDPLRYDSAQLYFNNSFQYVKNVDNLKGFATMLFAHNQSQAAPIYFEGALKLARTDSEKAEIANNLGRAYATIHQMFEAESAYLTALNIYENLIKTNPAEFEKPRAMVCNNLAELYRKNNRMEEADKMYTQAIETYERLQKFDITSVQPELARTLMNYGIYQSDIGDKVKSAKYYREALMIYQHLSETDPDKFEPELARTAMNLGNLYGADTLAKIMLVKAVERYERLSKKDPAQFEPLLAMASMNLGVYHWKNHESLEAKMRYLQSLEIYERLAKMNSIQHEPELAKIKLNLGNYYDKEHIEEKERMYIESFKILVRFSKVNPDLVNPNLAKVSVNLGMMYQSMQMLEKADTFFMYSKHIYELLLKGNPAAYRKEVAILYADHSDFYLFRKNFPEAINLAEKSLILDSSPDGSWVNCNLGHGYLLQGNLKKAKEVYTIYLAGEKDKNDAIVQLLKDFKRFREANIFIPYENEVRVWLKKST